MSIRNKVLIACYNWDKRVLGLPFEKYSLRGVSKLEFDLNAPAFSVRRDLIAFDLSLIIWKKVLDSSGSQESLTNIEKFHDWLRNTRAGQTIFSEALKIADLRLSRDLDYHKVQSRSIEENTRQILGRLTDIGLVILFTSSILTLVLILLIFLSKYL